MVNDIVNWNTVAMIIVAVLGIHAGIKLINRLFDKDGKKKNSLF
jgi:uncharacterized membrane protein SpoIIM required for sporulation